MPARQSRSSGPGSWPSTLAKTAPNAGNGSMALRAGAMASGSRPLLGELAQHAGIAAGLELERQLLAAGARIRPSARTCTWSGTM